MIMIFFSVLQLTTITLYQITLKNNRLINFFIKKYIDKIYHTECNVSYQKSELFVLISQKRGYIS